MLACGLGVYFFFGAAAPRNAPIPAVIRVTADDRFELYLNGTQVGAGDDWHRTYYFNVNLRPGPNLIAVKGENLLLEAGLLFDMQAGKTRVVSGPQWKTSVREVPGWNQLGFDDSNWSSPIDYGPHGVEPWGRLSQFPSDTTATWIWGEQVVGVVYFRHVFQAGK